MIDTEKSWTWELPPDCGAQLSNDGAALLAQLLQTAQLRGFSARELGRVADHPIWCLTRPARRSDAPRLLLASGFHGEESAGPWGVLRALRDASTESLDRVHLTVLPLVNPTGFNAGRRFNEWGENPNRGYPSLAVEDGPPSREGRILLEHAELLLDAGRDGVLSCHEDVGVEQAYLYSFERSARPGAFSQALLAANTAHFPCYPDGLVDDCPIEGGIVFNHYDGSFEAWLMEQGALRAACVETPGQQPLASRIAAQAAMMTAFIALGGAKAAA
ncbi:M14 family metallopeptidase [Paucibacter soli]|uniref:M14 family metallopeptidase n=1 Tax=Paucibacter soli TaxID=3133433 RepID=UPI00309914DE